MKWIFVALAALVGASLCAADAQAVFFDLHNLPPAAGGRHTLTVGNTTIQLQTNGAGTFISTATTFGMDSSGANDNAALFDGGNGFAENFSIMSSPTVLLESVLVSQFDAIDHGSLAFKGGPTITLMNGVNPINVVISGSSGHFLNWTGDTSTGGGRGFSVDGFTARLVSSATNYITGDFDGNNRVDAADYITWRKGLNKSYTLSAYATWKAHLGQTTSGSGSAMGTGTVPEPGLSVFLLTTVLVAVRRRTR